MSDFFPSSYELPKGSSNYMRLEQGENRFRVLSEHPITGWLYWTQDNKPVRLREFPKEMPLQIKVRDQAASWEKGVKHFWDFAVWDYASKSIKILEITQATIQNSLDSLFHDKDWGHPKSYDILITRTGESMDTEYQTIAKPHTALLDAIVEAYKSKNINLEALYDSKDPFAKS